MIRHEWCLLVAITFEIVAVNEIKLSILGQVGNNNVDISQNRNTWNVNKHLKIMSARSCSWQTVKTEGHTCTERERESIHERIILYNVIHTQSGLWGTTVHATDVLVEKLNPMLVKYKVAAYFSGHDHDMQHLNDSGVQYFLSGAGHLVESSQKHKVGKKFWNWSVYKQYLQP